MAPDAAALSQPPHSGTRQDQDAESFGFESDADLKRMVTPPKFDSLEEERQYLKERIALACRIFAQYGLDHHIAGHLTVRVPGEPDSFYVNPFSRSFKLMDAEDIITVSHTGDVIGGGKPGRRVVNKAGFLTRPDVQAICHSHSTYGKAWSTLGLPLEYTTQDSCAFYGRQSVLDSFGGVVLSKSEGARIAEKLGEGVLVVLQNHGLLTVGHTIDAAVARFILAEEQCRVSLLAHGAAQSLGTKVIQIADEEAKFTSNQGEEPIAYFMASGYFEVAEHLWGEEVRAKRN
ncbi:hypothetical protein JCM10021v2_003307 [Rhodotorula toruloides]|uniref:BY PROTMAP: gi/472586497/gb/EMS24016.1/ class II aldolase/adducin domain containing protein [Rhodosporidium toruloides NP11] gi/647397901/emb/CDR41307.1/ RHTO0S06e00540g1_1 [Rhodosporidium toruloides] n=1 Tax=Rhodotorula toruloides TaxID=5286 RepID=A0A0K3C5M1_RHOTO